MARLHTESFESFLAQTQILSQRERSLPRHTLGHRERRLPNHTMDHTDRYLLHPQLQESGIPCASAALESIACDTSNPGKRARGLQSPDTEPPWRIRPGRSEEGVVVRRNLLSRRCHLVKLGRTRFVFGKHYVDLRVGRNGNDHAAIGIEAHYLGVTRSADILSQPFA
jgi:hypothetical protein